MYGSYDSLSICPSTRHQKCSKVITDSNRGKGVRDRVSTPLYLRVGSLRTSPISLLITVNELSGYTHVPSRTVFYSQLWGPKTLTSVLWHLNVRKGCVHRKDPTTVHSCPRDSPPSDLPWNRKRREGLELVRESSLGVVVKTTSKEKDVPLFLGLFENGN